MSDATNNNDASQRLSTASSLTKQERDGQAALASSKGAIPKKIAVGPESLQSDKSYIKLIKDRDVCN